MTEVKVAGIPVGWAVPTIQNLPQRAVPNATIHLLVGHSPPYEDNALDNETEAFATVEFPI